MHATTHTVQLSSRRMAYRVDTIPSEKGSQAISLVREEPCRGDILVEEEILRRTHSPSGGTFSYHGTVCCCSYT
jgi:hypothetical protein